MARYLSIHPDDPQPRLIRQAADAVRDGSFPGPEHAYA